MTVILVAALVPLALTGVGSFLLVGTLLDRKALEVHSAVVTSHAATINLFFAEWVRALELTAMTHSEEALRSQESLEDLFAHLNRSYGNAFVDLGVIDERGRHVAYVGPHDLHDRNYSEAEWFRYVVQRGTYVSDVFLGFRGLPHCVIAVRRGSGRGALILRATVNSDQLDSLVHTGLLGQTGDAFLVNGEGVYQTPPRAGNVLDVAPIERPTAHRGVRHSRIELPGRPPLLQATAWLADPQWMLVVQQDAAEVRAPVLRALLPGVLVVLIAVGVLVVATWLATRHLTSRIEVATLERDEMSRDLLRSAKLASLGEMSTGLAHEINNPLGIISAEKTNIADLVGLMDPRPPEHDELVESVGRIGRQVERCAAITSKMLRFGRHGGGELRPTNIVPHLREVVGLLERQAAVNNVALHFEAERGLPRVVVDPTELEQVVVNLVSNSLQAIEGEGHIEISALREGERVLLTVEDDGPGIPKENLERVFQPFFTTKPVGKGTGLGLSVCYGIVSSWGGTVEAESEPGQGTRMVISLPVAEGARGSDRD